MPETHLDDEKEMRQKYLQLFTSANIFQELKGVEDTLLSKLSTCSATRVMLDNATIDYALSILAQGEYQWWKPKLPSRTDIYVHSVYQLIDALVLYDEILVGPGDSYTAYSRDDVAATQRILKKAEDLFNAKELFAMLNIARNSAKEAIAIPGAFTQAFEEMTTTSLDLDAVTASIDRLIPDFAYHSPHYYEDLSIEEEEESCIENVAFGALGKSRISMDASDIANLGRKYSTNDYFELAKRMNFQFPSKNYNEFYAAALVVRTFFYLFSAELTGCSYYADAYRAPLTKAILKNVNSKNRFVNIIMTGISDHEEKRDDIVNEVLGFEAFKLDTPPVASAILHKARSLNEVLSTALEIRSSRRATEFRRYCSQIDQAIESGERKRVEKAINDLTEIGIELTKEIGGATTASAFIDTTKELASFGSPLIAAIWPLLKNPITKLYKKVKYRRLAFLSDLQQVPRIISPAEQQLRRLLKTV